MHSFLCILAIFYYEVNQVSALKVITRQAPITQPDVEPVELQDSLPTEHGSDGPSENSPWKNTILLLQSVRPDRMALMNKVYGKWFGSVKFMVWKHDDTSLTLEKVETDDALEQGRLREEIEDELEDTRLHPDLSLMATSTAFRDQIISCPRSERFNYHSACLSPFLKEIDGSAFTGVLTMHMDFWINPVRLNETSNLNAIWQLDGGLKARVGRGQKLGPLCFHDRRSEAPAHKVWGWWHNSNNLGKQALTDLKAALKGNPELLPVKTTKDMETCAGWSDMYYLPKSTWHHFLNIAPFYKNVFHEVAVPTMLSHLNKASVAPVSLKQCGGGCCSQSDIHDSSHACGHRYDFKIGANRVRWENWMDGLLNTINN